MEIVNGELLDRFLTRHRTAHKVMTRWKRIVGESRWRTPADVGMSFSRYSVLRGNRLVIDVGGNNYRIVAVADYARQRLELRFVGTHDEYDKIDAEVY